MKETYVQPPEKAEALERFMQKKVDVGNVLVHNVFIQSTERNNAL